MGFFPSFTFMLLHSLWQAAILLCVYTAINFFNKKIHPLQKRNFLCILITAQLLISAFTFFMCLTNSNFNAFSFITIQSVAATLSGVFVWEKYADIIVYSYFAIILFRTLAICNQWVKFKMNCTIDLIKPSAELKVFTELKACQLGIRKKVMLRYSRYISSPLTFGFIKPFILLPFSLVNRLSTAEVESILLHELCHIKNHDYLLNWIVILTENIYFFNPFLLLIIKKLKGEREKNCDVQVLNFNYSRIEYAETLLKTARLTTALNNFHLAAVGKKTQLLHRIYFFSEEQNLVFKNNKCTSIFLSIAFFLIANAIILPLFNKKESASTEINFISTYAIKKSTENSIRRTIHFSNDKKETVIAKNKINKKKTNAPTPSPENEISTFDNADFNRIPVSYNLTPDSTKEFIYNEETQNGNIIQSFKLVLIKGKWIMQPQWMILETKPDSSRKIFTDTLLHKNIPS